MEFDKYLKSFEKRVVARGIAEGSLGKTEQVSVRPDKLSALPFGEKMGEVIDHHASFAIDYYGYIKKSKGFFNQAGELAKSTEKQPKDMRVVIVHFASVRVEKVAKLAPSLVADFPGFKKEILDTRGFNHKYEV